MRFILLISLFTVTLASHSAPVRISYEGVLYDISLVETMNNPMAESAEPWYGNRDAARNIAALVGDALGTPNEILGYDPENPFFPPVEGFLGAAFVYATTGPLAFGPSDFRQQYSAECFDPLTGLVSACNMETRLTQSGEFLLPDTSLQRHLIYRAHASEVPLPAAAWLFGSGLLGLAGILKRRPIKRRAGQILPISLQQLLKSVNWNPLPK